MGICSCAAAQAAVNCELDNGSDGPMEGLQSSLATSFPVASLRFRCLHQVIREYKDNGSPPVEEEDGESFEMRLERVQSTLSSFPQPPFTLQRMAELLTEPTRFYSNLTKFFRSFSKLVCGISGRVTNAPVVADRGEAMVSYSICPTRR